jgi:hypothetical protein
MQIKTIGTTVAAIPIGTAGGMTGEMIPWKHEPARIGPCNVLVTLIMRIDSRCLLTLRRTRSQTPSFVSAQKLPFFSV